MTKTILTKLLCFIFALCFVFVGCTDKELPSNANVSDDLLSKSLDSISENQEKFMAMNFDRLSVSANAEIVIGDGFYDLMNKVGDAPAAGNMLKKLGLNSVKVHTDIDRNDDVFKISVDGKVNGTVIISGDGIVDLNNEQLYLDVPALSDQTAKADISYALSEADFDEVWSSIGTTFERFINFDESVNSILSDDELFAIIEDYFNCGLEQLDAPETGSKSISVEKISQKVDYKKYTIDERGAIGFAKAVVSKLRDDKNVRDKFIQLYPVFVNYIEETLGYEYEMDFGALPSAEELYDEKFLPLLEEAVAQLEDYNFSDSDTNIYLEQYFVDGNFVGFSYSVPDGGVFNFYSVENSTDVAFTCNINTDDGSSDIDVTLIGKVYNGVFNGDLKFSCRSTSYEYDYSVYEVVPTSSEYGFSIGIEDVDLNKMEKGIMNGTVVIDLNSFKDLVSDDLPEGLVLKISFESDGYFNGKFSISAESDAGLILTYKFDYKIADDAKDIVIPVNAVPFERWEMKDEEELLRYFIDKLKKAGINESLLMMAESEL